MKTGQRVVCIDGEFYNIHGELGTGCPKKGHIANVVDSGSTEVRGMVINWIEIDTHPYKSFDERQFETLDENWTEKVITKALQQQLTKKELV